MAQINGKFAEEIQSAMDKQGVSIKDLAEAADSTYEHTRKVVKGLAFPSKHVMKAITKHLHLDYTAMDKIAVEDRIKMKYGSVASALAKIPPRLEPLVSLESQLSDSDIEEIVAIARLKARIHRDKVRVS